MHPKCIDAAFVRPCNRKFEAAEFDGLSPARQSAEFVHHETTDRVVLFVIQFAFEVLVEIFDPRQCAYGETGFAVSITIGTDVILFFGVMLVVNLDHDFLEKIFYREESCDTPILVDDVCHVIMARTKLVEQRV